MQRLSCLIFILHLAACTQAQKGCTDKKAVNYDPNAIENDGSCVYSTTALSPSVIISPLSDTLQESSGLIWFRNSFWTINDSGNDPVLWAFDAKGHISRAVRIVNASNTDWEELTQDSNYIYIGDFGNNEGSRTDLHILKISKKDIRDTTASVNAYKIRFSFPDQADFTPRNQAHNFDLEACFVLNNSLHLFTKNWVDGKTRYYTLPCDTGTFVATLRDSFNTAGLITGACTDSSGDYAALTGYTKSGSCFMWLLWDYKPGSFFSGNKRRIELGNGLSLGQNEAICYRQPFSLFLSNEKRFTPQSLRSVNVFDLYWQDLNDVTWLKNFKYYPQPAASVLHIVIDLPGPEAILSVSLADMNGRNVYHRQLKDMAAGQQNFDIDIKEVPQGNYVLMLQGAGGTLYRKLQVSR